MNKPMRLGVALALAGAAPAVAGALGACARQPGEGVATRAAPAPPSRLAYSTASREQIQSQPPPGSCRYRGTGLFVEPDPHCTPGALSPQVTQRNLAQTICRAGGYTEFVRPPLSVTEPEKRASMAAYGNAGDPWKVEYDHLVPLSLGGAANDPRNLWPEPDYPHVSSQNFALNPKDKLEERLHDLVCSGALPLAVAQQTIARDWVGAYRRWVR